jgi:hypothetical protein
VHGRTNYIGRVKMLYKTEHLNWRQLPPNMDLKFLTNKTRIMAFKERDPVRSKNCIK